MKSSIFWLGLGRAIASIGPMMLTAWTAAARPMDHFGAADVAIDLLKNKKFRTMADAIAGMPRELRQNFALVRDSRSLQAGSPQYPRVIMYSVDGRIFVTFNGHPDQRGYDSIEWMFRPAGTWEYDFQSLKFDETSSGGVLSELNPARCQSCHGRDRRPIWDVAPRWPDLFGAFERWTEAESQDLSQRQLAWQRDERYGGLDWQDYGRAGDETPAVQVERLIENAQIERIARWVAGSSDYSRWQHAIKGALLGCEQVVEFLPERIRPEATKLAELRQNTIDWLRRQTHEQQSTQTEQVVRTISLLRWLFEDRDHRMAIWARTVGHPYLHTGNGMAFYGAIAQRLASSEAVENCQDLRNASLLAWEGE